MFPFIKQWLAKRAQAREAAWKAYQESSMKYLSLIAVLFFSLSTLAADPAPTPPPIDPGIMVTLSTAVYPDYNLMEVYISGDGRTNQRHMTMVVPLFDTITRQRVSQWVYDFKGQEYNDAQAAFTSDKALFQQLLIKVGAPAIVLTSQPDNLANVIPVSTHELKASRSREPIPHGSK
jgi:hypothetical protein